MDIQNFLLMALLLFETTKKWLPKDGSWILDPETFEGLFLMLVDRIRAFYLDPILSPKWPIWER